MAEEAIREKNCYSITWFIHNFSYCWQKKNEAIVSPIFSIYMPEETKWKLLLFPRGTANERYIAFYLARDKDCNGVESIEIEYSLECLNGEGSLLSKGEITFAFLKDSRWGYPNFRPRDLVFVSRRMKYIPEDLFIVCCRIKLGSKHADKFLENRNIFARTIINVERKLLLWTIDEFSSLKPNEKKNIAIKSASKEELIKIELFLTGGQCSEEKINLNIRPGGRSMKFLTLKTFILDALKSKVDTGELESICEFGKSSIFTLNLSRDKLIENKHAYLPSDTISLKLEFAIATGFVFEAIEKINFGAISHRITNEVLENQRKCNIKERIDPSSALINDLMSLYLEQSLCDVKLQAKTKVFPAHISILSARSPVFKAMFSSEMKENLNRSVDMSYLDDEVVQKLLLYLYTGKLKEFEWHDIIQLYGAADKYSIISLKEQCSLLLKSNLDLENACETLILSDMHQDEDLKNTTQEFILRNAKEIFKSEQWKLLADANSKLALETTIRNWNG